MNITKFGIIWSGIKGFLNPFGSTAGSIISYVLEAVRAAGNAAMCAIPEEKKAKVSKWLEVAKLGMGWLLKFQSAVPAKWQLQYKETVEAVQAVIDACEDLEITEDEMAKVEKECREAVEAWEKD